MSDVVSRLVMAASIFDKLVDEVPTVVKLIAFGVMFAVVIMLFAAGINKTAAKQITIGHLFLAFFALSISGTAIGLIVSTFANPLG